MYIKNTEELARSKEREDALSIIESGYAAIDNRAVIERSVVIKGNTLHISGQEINMNEYERMHIIAFGKGSGEAALSLMERLDGRVKSGVVIDKVKLECAPLRCFVGTHPIPSKENLQASEQLIKMAEHLSEKDLVLVVVTGGGSSLLNYPESESDQGARLYNAFLKVGATIHDMNLVRKHISSVKGGGLAKLLYPARVVGLIFSDVLGDNASEVASGPTYPDKSTIEDAQNILAKWGIPDKFDLVETPKESKWFEKVTNLVLISNMHALHAMRDKAEELGYKAIVVEEPLYNFADETLISLRAHAEPGSVVLGGGEIRMIIKHAGGRGGRCGYLSLHALHSIRDGQIFSAVASDGTDNGTVAGAIVDSHTIDQVREKGINVHESIINFDPMSVFEKTGDLIETGQLKSNVSDLYILLTPKSN